MDAPGVAGINVDMVTLRRSTARYLVWSRPQDDSLVNDARHVSRDRVASRGEVALVRQSRGPAGPCGDVGSFGCSVEAGGARLVTVGRVGDNSHLYVLLCSFHTSGYSLIEVGEAGPRWLRKSHAGTTHNETQGSTTGCMERGEQDLCQHGWSKLQALMRSVCACRFCRNPCGNQAP